jgi:hypothetical protein
VTLFRTVGRERAWRQQRGMDSGFHTLDVFHPLVAVGAEKPLADQLILADYFRASSARYFVLSLYIFFLSFFFLA